MTKQIIYVSYQPSENPPFSLQTQVVFTFGSLFFICYFKCSFPGVCLLVFWFLLHDATLIVKQKRKHKLCTAQDLPRPSILLRSDISNILHFSLYLYLTGLSSYRSFTHSKPTVGVQSSIKHIVAASVCAFRPFCRKITIQRFCAPQISILHTFLHISSLFNHVFFLPSISFFCFVLFSHSAPVFILNLCNISIRQGQPKTEERAPYSLFSFLLGNSAECTISRRHLNCVLQSIWTVRKKI